MPFNKEVVLNRFEIEGPFLEPTQSLKTVISKLTLLAEIISDLKKLILPLLFCITSFGAQAQCWKDVAVGMDHTIALKPDGTLWAWGFNGSGQLGIAPDTSVNTRKPVKIGADSDWIVVAAGGNQSFAIKSNGTLWAWGDNFYGQLGLVTFGNSVKSPTQVGVASDWKSIAVGTASTFAIKNNGTLWCWGQNILKDLGIGSDDPVFQPRQIDASNDWQMVAVNGNHTLAIKTNGTLWSWGSNFSGAVGDGTTIIRSTPFQIGTGSNWKYVTCGYAHSLAIKNDGTLWAWGNNFLGNLGDNTFVDKYAPIQIGSDTNWKTVVAGLNTSIGIKTDGSLWAWGQILGTITFAKEDTKKIPTPFVSTLAWQSIFLSYSTAFAFNADGTLWGWGSNDWGQLGKDDFSDDVVPRIVSIPAPVGEKIQAFCRVATVADLQATGTNVQWYAAPTGGAPLSGSETLVNGNHYYAKQTFQMCESAYPLDVSVVVNLTNTLPPAGDAVQTFCGAITVANLAATGTGIKWYTSATGGSPLSSNTTLIDGGKYYASQQVSYCESPTRLEVTFILKKTSAFTGITNPVTLCEGVPFLYAYDVSKVKWYFSSTGDTGIPASAVPKDGTIYYAAALDACGEATIRTPILFKVNATPPPSSLMNDTWSFIDAGDNDSFGIKPDGTMWTWGKEISTFYGQPTYKYYPSQVYAGNTWVSISSGGYHYSAINTNGEIFDGTSYNLYTPVNSARDWSKVSSYGLLDNDYHVSAIKNDGTLWTWGANNAGQLGDGTNVSKTVPVKIGAAEWKSVWNGYQFTIAIKNDGSLWAWGRNDHGQLGDGSTVNRNVPTRIGTDTWAFISVTYSSCMGIKSDGTLWGWGDNSYGKLGLGSMVEKRSPSKVGAGQWTTVSMGANHTLAIRTDGTLWAWGSNDLGALGRGKFTFGDSWFPIQVGSDTNWKSVSAGGGHSIALAQNGIIWTWGANSSGQLGIDKVVAIWYEPIPLPSKIYLCGQSIALANAPVQGTNVKWGYILNQDALGPLAMRFDPLGYNGVHFYATQTINGMESCKMLSVLLDPGSPLQPFSSRGTDQAFCSGGVVDNLSPAGTSVTWFETSSGGSPLAKSTPLINGKEYYASQNFGGCPTVNRLKVVAHIGPPNAPTGPAIQTFCQNVGTQIINLSATGSSIRWYDTPSGGSPLMVDTPLINGNHYYAAQSFQGCESLTRLDVEARIINTSAPTGPPLQNFCVKSTNILVSDLVASGSSIMWYPSLTGQTSFAPTQILGDGGHYFGSQNIPGCESSSRLEVVVKLIYAPGPPSGSSSQTFCATMRATLASLSVTGSSVSWYATSAGGSPLPLNTLLADGVHYYAEQIGQGGCESYRRLDVQTFIVSPPVPSAPDTQVFCFESAPRVSNLVATVPFGATLRWYSTLIGGSPLPVTTLLSNGHYFAATVGGACESVLRREVVAQLYEPPAPTGTAAQIISPGNTITAIAITGTSVKWYPSAEDAAARTNRLLSTTPLVDGKRYYATQTISGCESKTALMVEISIGTVTAIESALESLNIFPNPSNGIVHITHGEIIEEVILLNLMGQSVLSKTVGDRQVQLDISGLSAGIYTIQIRLCNTFILEKIAKL